VGHKAITKTLNTRTEEVEESQKEEHRLSILRLEFGLSQKATILAQFAFFLLGHHFCLRLTLRTFFFLHGSLLEPGRDPVDD
jgi:hypothetical protein